MDPLHELLDHSCTRCLISDGVRSVCIGGRNAVTDIKMVVFGEAPASEEDREGSFFVGPAGRLLEQLLDEAGVDRAKIRLENVTRCFSRDDRGLVTSPSKTSVAACMPYSYRILAQILRQDPAHPPLIVALGNTAFEALTGHRSISKNSGVPFPMVAPPEWSSLADRFRVIGSIHPSALLRNPNSATDTRKKIVADLRFAWQTATGSPSEGAYWRDYRWVDSVAEFAAWVDARIDEDAIVGFDLETNSVDFLFHPDGRIVCINLCASSGQAIVVPVWHFQSPWLNDPAVQRVVIGHLTRLLIACRIVVWGGKYDIDTIRLRAGQFDPVTGWEPATFPIRLYLDAQDAARFLYGPKKPGYELDDWVASDLGFRGHGRGLVKTDLFNAPWEKLLAYGGGDADGTLQFAVTLREQLVKFGLLESYERLLLDAVEDVVSMEVAGVKVSRAMNSYLLEAFPRQMEPIVEEIRRSPWGQATTELLRNRTIPDKNTGGQKSKPLEFNLGSPTTVQTLLFQTMGMPVNPEKVGKTGPSADKDVLEQLEEYCQENGLDEQGAVITNLGKWRGMKDEYTRYVVPISEQLDPADFYHPSYKMTGVATGRFSSSFHGFPRESKVKLQFVSRWLGKGGVLIFADYSAAEMRVMASLSGDPALIEVLSSDEDVHREGAARMFGIPVEEVTDDQRQIGKRCIAEGQLVLTEERGPVPIEQVTIADHVWDGVEWVSHEGLIDQGVREVIKYLNGNTELTATPDHVVFGLGGLLHPMPMVSTGNHVLAMGAYHDWSPVVLHAHAPYIPMGRTGFPRLVPAGLARTYDLQNAGPRHRFTAGKFLVSNCNFGISMKIGAKKLASQLGTTPEKAQTHIDRYLRTFPRMPAWQREQWEFGRKHGFVTTVFGRVLWIDGIENSKFGDRETRESGSYPIQSPASDCTRLALSACIRELRRLGCRSKFFSFIHDSIGADVAPGEWFAVARTIRAKMEDWTREVNPWIKVPMRTDLKICAGSWGTPCSLEFTDDPNVMRAAGPVRNVDRLLMEAENIEGFILLSRTDSETKKGKTRTIEFSFAPVTDSPDARVGMAGVTF